MAFKQRPADRLWPASCLFMNQELMHEGKLISFIFSHRVFWSAHLSGLSSPWQRYADRLLARTAVIYYATLMDTLPVEYKTVGEHSSIWACGSTNYCIINGKMLRSCAIPSPCPHPSLFQQCLYGSLRFVFHRKTPNGDLSVVRQVHSQLLPPCGPKAESSWFSSTNFPISVK